MALSTAPSLPLKNCLDNLISSIMTHAGGMWWGEEADPARLEIGPDGPVNRRSTNQAGLYLTDRETHSSPRMRRAEKGRVYP